MDNNENEIEEGEFLSIWMLVLWDNPGLQILELW